MEYKAKIEINAPADKVWQLLTDVSAQNQWNSTLIKLEGAFEKGKTLIFVTKVAPKQPFKVQVKDIAPGNMVLTGGMPLGLFRGNRTFRVYPTGTGRSVFETREVFTGPLVGLMKKVMPDLQPSFDQWALDLKKASEA